jgi:ribosomal protein L11 methyltransferase
MSWLQLSLTVSENQAPLIEALFENMGALSVTFGDAGDEPILEPDIGETPMWQATRVTALFEGTQDPDTLRGLVSQSLKHDLCHQLQLERLEDQAWERTWLDAFHPMRFGQRLWVCPAGQLPEQDDAIILELDPGLAFGTGTHPTTALCLGWLDQSDLAGKEVIDYGCGSGILAVAALALGAKQVIAVDHDPQALEATKDNAAKNRVGDRLSIHSVEEVPTTTCDIMVANILAGTLITLEPTLAKLVAPGGQIILSGILTEQATSVAKSYDAHFQMNKPIEQEGWVLLEGKRRLG